MSRQPELAQSVKLPDTRAYDLRGASGPWIDYFRSTYPDWAKACEPSQGRAVPWPEGFEPTTTPVFAHNEIALAAPPAKVFATLLEARRWPTYYENASQVELLDAQDRLGPGVQFRFTTFGVVYDAKVIIFEPERALAWNCHGGTPELSVHHRWLLEPIATGTLLITEETNYISSLSWLNPLNRWLNQQLADSGAKEALSAAHQRWLTELKRVVETNNA